VEVALGEALDCSEAREKEEIERTLTLLEAKHGGVRQQRQAG